ncbi:MAG: hypothetical protein FJ406_02145 [Verrucomicrobia bacterium]|nr:hypothetical protein [Verrucomicrobiota bacterium]
MKETIKTALRTSAVLAVALGLCVTGLTAAKPPQGDQATWTKLCTDLVNATATLEKGEAGAADKFKAAVNCKACHDEFKPAAKK